jgi:hypothetical protein
MPPKPRFGHQTKRFEPPLVVAEFGQPFPNAPTVPCEVTERTDETGCSYLSCNCPQFAMTKPGDESFCEHLRIVLEKNWDGHPKDAPKREMTHRIWVPIFRSPGLSVPVTINKVDEKLRRVEILRTKDGITQPEFLGFIQLGQGRGAIRTLVTEWLIEQSTKPIPECQAPYHGMSTKLTVVDLNKTNLSNLADLLITGSCRSCNEDAAIPDV